MMSWADSRADSIGNCGCWPRNGVRPSRQLESMLPAQFRQEQLLLADKLRTKLLRFLFNLASHLSIRRCGDEACRHSGHAIRQDLHLPDAGGEFSESSSV